MRPGRALTCGVLPDGAVVHGQHVVHQLNHADGHVLDLQPPTVVITSVITQQPVVQPGKDEN